MEKTGNRKEAIVQLVNVMGNVKEAVKYALRARDEGQRYDLLNDISKLCRQDEAKLTELLHYLEYYENTKTVIASIPSDFTLGKIKSALKNSFHNLEV